MNIGQALHQVGDLEQRLSNLKQVGANWEKAYSLQEIAASLLRTNLKKETLEIVNQAYSLAKTIEPDWHKVRLVAKVASIYAKTGDQENAEALAKELMFDFRINENDKLSGCYTEIRMKTEPFHNQGQAQI